MIIRFRTNRILMTLICKGGKLRDHGHFAIIKQGKFELGRRHRPMSKTDRCRYFNRKNKQYNSDIIIGHKHFRIWYM